MKLGVFMTFKENVNAIKDGNTALGLELGSTRIKACLINRDFEVIASSDFVWENKLVGKIWTYDLEDVHFGLRECYKGLADSVKDKFGLELETVGSIGISGMMHGYLPFDENKKQLAAFRTWRNTITAEAAEILSDRFDFNVPQRWSVAHLYQSILNGEEHVERIKYLSTLSGYIHWRLTGEFVLGIGEASGMFPIDSKSLDYDAEMIKSFDELIKDKGLDFSIKEILPKVLTAGENAGSLTKEGALFLDPKGILKPGIVFAAPEGDMQTGMVATNSVKLKTGNVSAGTSDSVMVVLDKKLKRHKEIDMISTPAGLDVAMVHCNNCTSDINAWIGLFKEFADEFGMEVDKNRLYTQLFNKALEGDADCGGLMSYNYYSGEPILDLDEGRLIFMRMPDARFNLANFMRTHLMSAIASLKVGMDILTVEEKVKIDKLNAHGGYFKTADVGQRILAAAADVPIDIMSTAGEGGPFGMALLASYIVWNKEKDELGDYLEKQVFKNVKVKRTEPIKSEADAFNRFTRQYKKSLIVERKAVESTKDGRW